jgi:hypothetical protein
MFQAAQVGQRASDEQVMRDILGYFVRHPQAADTLDGIVRFRVMEELLHRSVPETEAALDRLVASGLLRRESVPGTGVIYSLDDRRRDEARRALDSDEPLGASERES